MTHVELPYGGRVLSTKNRTARCSCGWSSAPMDVKDAVRAFDAHRAEAAENATQIVHAFCSRCHPAGTLPEPLCDAPVRRERLPDDTPVDCVVCGSFTHCPRCGVEMIW